MSQSRPPPIIFVIGEALTCRRLQRAFASQSVHTPAGQQRLLAPESLGHLHLKLNDQAQRTVLCKDPFAAVDARVERLIASM